MFGLRFKLKRYQFKKKLKERRKNPLTQTETYAIEISKNLIRRRDSQLIYSPNSGDRFILNKPLEVYITLKDNTIDICNHNYRYRLILKDDAIQDIIKLHNQAIETRKREMEKAMGRNSDESLEKLLLFVNSSDA